MSHERESRRKARKTGKKTVKGFQVLEEECIWMKARVVNFRLCDNAYDCYSCPFDKGMKKAMKPETPSNEKQETSWVEHLKWNYADASRPCQPCAHRAGDCAEGLHQELTRMLSLCL